MYIGLDVGGTKILGALINNKTIVSSHKEKTNAANSTAEQIFEQIKSVITTLKKDNPIKGIGIGIPGSINTQTGVIGFSPNLPFKDFPIKEKLAQHFNVPIAIENDVNAGLLGEHWAGAAKEYSNVVGIFVGTGIGGAIIINDQLYHGKHSIAGEIGHMKLKINGPACNCGEKGCLEALASKVSIQRALEKQGFTFDSIIKSSFIKEQLEKGNKEVKEVMKKAAISLGEAAGSIVNILDPEAIILGGGVMESLGDFFLKKIKPVANKRALVKPNIKLASLGDYSIVYGAVYLVKSE